MVKFIRESGENSPLFIYHAPWAPHKPATPAPHHAELYSDLKAPREPSFNEADVSDKPAFVRARPLLTDEQIAEIDEYHRNRLRTLVAVDESMGRIVEALDAAGRLDNTFFFYTSDSGFHLGHHRLYLGKGGPYEENIRVPLIVRGPGVAPGRTIDRFALSIGLAPTLAELAGAQAPSFVDGRSLVPLLRGATPEPWRNTFLIEHWGEKKGFRGLRARDLVYVEYTSGEREFYDLSRDPHQLESAHADADPERARALAGILERLARCKADSCREAEELPLPPTADAEP